jgi:hypothetical protein
LSDVHGYMGVARCELIARVPLHHLKMTVDSGMDDWLPVPVGRWLFRHGSPNQQFPQTPRPGAGIVRGDAHALVPRFGASSLSAIGHVARACGERGSQVIFVAHSHGR